MENVASRFGQRLAHTEKKYRDQALKKLTLYLTKRTEWSDLEWDKLWKALFYCMWMSDKRPIQEELSSNLAGLVHKIPSVDDALGFVHSFFRTMHREWHGIDGLRLDKFYSLIRKFVHQSLVLLLNQGWATELVQRFVSIVSSEVMSQLPNGLRLHITDLFMTELYGAAADNIDTDSFLLLLEPFFTLMSSEYDKTVFKRVRELVFLPMLTEYKFGKQPEKKAKKATKSESGETDEEEEEEEVKVFAHVELAQVQHRIFSIASADDTAERNRSVLYDLYSDFFRVTKVDSLKAAQEEAKNPKPKTEKKRKQPEPTEEQAPEEATENDEPKKKKKNKKRKNKRTEEETAHEEELADELMAGEEPVATPEKKKSKKTKDSEKTPESTPVKTKEAEETPSKKQKKEKKVEDVEMEAATPGETTPDTKKSKKQKKAEAQAAAIKEEPKKQKKDIKEEPVEESTPSKKEKKEKKKVEEEPKEVKKEPTEVKKEPKKDTKDDNVVVRSGVKFTRCAACRGFGKGVVAKGKELCRRCERTGAKVKKVKAAEAPAEKTKTKASEPSADKAKKSDAQVVVRSGMKFRRCGSCGGIGKGLVPVGKELCRHCERTGAQKKKKEQAANKKKRKAEEAAAATVITDDSGSSKKVTFGKNRALPHELSVKRLKASAKEPATKELTSDIKGVLKATSPASTTKAKSKKSAGRMKAADFF